MESPKSIPKKRAPGAPRGNKNASKHAGEETERISLRIPAGIVSHYRARAAADETTLSEILTNTLIQAKK